MPKLDPKVMKFLEGKNFGFLGTVSKDGSPHVAPVWVDTDGDYIYVNTAVGRVKHMNVKRDPRVGLSVSDQTNAYKRVSLKGRVVDLVVGNKADDHIDHLAQKYTGAKKYNKSSPDEKRMIMKIKVDKIIDLVA